MIYPKTIGSIEINILFHRKSGDIYCIGSRQSDRYIHAPAYEADIIYSTLQYMDGTLSLSEIQAKVDLNPIYNNKVDVDHIYHICLNAGLIEVADGEEVQHKTDEFELMLVNLKDFGLSKLYPFFHKIAVFLPIIVTIMIGIDLVAFLLAFKEPKIFPWNAVFSDTRALVYMWVIQLFSLVLHEFSHSIVGYRYGIKPKSFSIAVFYYCSLIFFIKLPGIYFKTPQERVKIWVAGMFTNLFLASFFYYLFLLSSGQLQVFAAVGVVSNILLILNNVMPFFYSDGYYLLSTLLKSPNLRKKSLFQFKKLIKGKFTRDTIVYWIYLIVTVLVTVLIIGAQVVAIAHSVLLKIAAGYSPLIIVRSYLNLIILMAVGVVGKIISSIRKRRASALKHQSA